MEHIKVDKLPGSSGAINKIAKAFQITFMLPLTNKSAYVHYLVSDEVDGDDLKNNKQFALVIEDREAVEEVIKPDPEDEEKIIVVTPAIPAKDDFTRFKKAIAEATEETFITDFILKNHKA